MASYAFDEFGNMIGGESSEDEAEQPPPAEEEDLSVAPMETDEPEEESRAITLHEDKQYYPEASEVYGEKVKTVVLDEDAQPITEPILKPATVKTFSVLDNTGMPATAGYTTQFLKGVVGRAAIDPERVFTWFVALRQNIIDGCPCRTST